MAKLKDLTEGISTIDLLVLDYEERLTKAKKPYVVFTVTDGDHKAFVRMWDRTGAEASNTKGKVMRFSISTATYKGELNYTAIAYNESSLPVSEFVEKAPVDCNGMFDYLKNIRINDPALKLVVNRILDTYRDQLLYYPAAKRMHHAISGGLLYHTYRMVAAAQAMASVYPVNSDLLYAGVILHDIGKLQELDAGPTGTAEYSIDGRLFGHAYLGMEIVKEFASETDLSADTLKQLLHIIASHHGKLEWGALTEPATIEAQIAHYLDMIDSRVYMYEDTFKDAEPGVTEKNFGLGNTLVKF